MNPKNKIYYLGTCDTCKIILTEAGAIAKKIPLQDIKTDKISSAQIDEMKKLAGSYEALFSRRAIKYREMDLKNKDLKEADYRNLILEEYTFLKRPVSILNNKIFIGNDKKQTEGLKEEILKLK